MYLKTRKISVLEIAKRFGEKVVLLPTANSAPTSTKRAVIVPVKGAVIRVPYELGSAKVVLADGRLASQTSYIQIRAPSSRRLNDLVNEDFCRLRSTVWYSHK
jgi:hypothetical protein